MWHFGCITPKLATTHHNKATDSVGRRIQQETGYCVMGLIYAASCTNHIAIPWRTHQKSSKYDRRICSVAEVTMIMRATVIPTCTNIEGYRTTIRAMFQLMLTFSE